MLKVYKIRVVKFEIVVNIEYVDEDLGVLLVVFCVR